MRALGFCALIVGGVLLIVGFSWDPSVPGSVGIGPGRVVNLGLLGQQIAIVTAGSAFCIAGTVLIVGGAVSAQLDRLSSKPSHSAPDVDPVLNGPSSGASEASGLSRENWSAAEDKARQLGYRVRYNSKEQLVIEKPSGRIEVFQTPADGWQYLSAGR